MSIYYLVDPICNGNSGITTYCKLMQKNISKICKCKIVAPGHDFRQFYADVNKLIAESSLTNDVIEIPDAYADKFIFSCNDNVHIRLHALSAICDIKQGNKIDIARLYAGLVNISKAKIVSAPSELIKKETERFIEITDCLIYPNAIPDCRKTTEKTNDYLFVGRFQRLKGVEYLPWIELFLGKRITVVSPDYFKISRLLYRRSYDDKYVNMEKSKVVLIPSIFESFSMVMYEALACNCFVVTWSNMPVPEELNHVVYKVKVGRCSEFARTCEIASKMKSAFNYKKLKEDYDLNIALHVKFILNNIKSKYYRNNKRDIKLDNVKSIMTETAMNNNTYRKIKKLFRDPKQYWADSKIRKVLCGNTEMVKETDVSVMNNLNDANYSLMIFDVGADGNVFVKVKNKINTKLKKDNCLFAVNSRESGDILQNIMKVANDVTQLKTDNFVELRINRKNSLVKDASVALLVKCFKNEDIEWLASFKFLIVVNPTDNIYMALRNLSCWLRVIAIVDRQNVIDTINNENVDYLIVDESLRVDDGKYRYIKRFTKGKNEFLKIRESLREISSKEPNYFLPILKSNNQTILDIEKFKIYDAIVRMKKPFCKGNFNTFEELGKKFEISELFVREEVFFRYKKIIELCSKNKEYSKLICWMLKDGGRLYVY